MSSNRCEPISSHAGDSSAALLVEESFSNCGNSHSIREPHASQVAAPMGRDSATRGLNLTGWIAWTQEGISLRSTGQGRKSDGNEPAPERNEPGPARASGSALSLILERDSNLGAVALDRAILADVGVLLNDLGDP